MGKFSQKNGETKHHVTLYLYETLNYLTFENHKIMLHPILPIVRFREHKNVLPQPRTSASFQRSHIKDLVLNPVVTAAVGKEDGTKAVTNCPIPLKDPFRKSQF